MDKKTTEEVLDLVKAGPKYYELKKKIGRGSNFDYDLVITPETRRNNPPGLHYYGCCGWWEARRRWKISRSDMVKLIENGKIIHTYKDPDSDYKLFRGEFKFVNREPSEEEWQRTVEKLKRDQKKTTFWILVILGILATFVIYKMS